MHAAYYWSNKPYIIYYKYTKKYDFLKKNNKLLEYILKESTIAV